MQKLKHLVHLKIEAVHYVKTWGKLCQKHYENKVLLLRHTTL